MTTPLARRAAALSAATVLSVSPLLIPGQAQAATPLTCRAHMSDSTPKQYSNTFVVVKTGKAKANVRTVAHYKTTNTVKKGKSNSAAKATLKYYVSGATPGYKVKVDVKVTKNGRSKTCTTSFTPHK